MAELNWTLQAKSDLVNIAEYIALDSKKYARIQIKRIRFKANQLRQFPDSGRTVPEYNKPSVKELILGNYRIIYHLVNPDRVDILTVHHSRRRLNIALPESI